MRLETGYLSVQTGPNVFWTVKKRLDAELDFRFSSCPTLNLDLNFGSVRISSGLNQGSEPNYPITTRYHCHIPESGMSLVFASGLMACQGQCFLDFPKDSTIYFIDCSNVRHDLSNTLKCY